LENGSHPTGLGDCGSCSVHCLSKFYTVTGTGGEMIASTCGGITNYPARLVVREGSTDSSCPDLLCIGTFSSPNQAQRASCCSNASG
jgi:hypothetical protein